MTLSDSLFLFEIVVEKLLSYVSCKEFNIRSQFADIFKLNLKDPNDLDPFHPAVTSQNKTKVSDVNDHNQKPPLGGQVQSGVSIFSGPIETLIRAMKKFPFKASLFNKDTPNRQLGSTCVPWSPVYIDYLYDNCFRKSNTPAQVSGNYPVYDEITSKRVATIKLKIKLSRLRDNKLTTSCDGKHKIKAANRSKTNKKEPIVQETSFRSLPKRNQNNVTKEAPSHNNYNSIEKIDAIKTVYDGVKHQIKAANRSKTKKKELIVQETSFRSLSKRNQNNVTKEAPTHNNFNSIEKIDAIKTVYSGRKPKIMAANGSKTNKKEPIVQETSFCSLSERNQNNVTKETCSYNNYNLIEKIGVIKTVYGGGKHKIKAANRSKTNKKEPIAQENNKPNRPLVETEENIDKKCKLKTCIASLAKSDTDLVKNRCIDIIQTNSCSSMNRKRVNILKYIFGDSNKPVSNQTYCVGYMTVENDLKNDARSKESLTQGKSSEENVSKRKISFKSCEKDCSVKKNDNMCSLDIAAEKFKGVKCKFPKFRAVPPPTDDRIQIDLRNNISDCCDGSHTIEKVAGKMNTKLNFNEHDCFCTCECKFGIEKHTTYCKVCDGFEIAGEDIPKNPLTAPIACPDYHNDMNKYKLVNGNGHTRNRRKKCDDLLKKKKGSKSPGSGPTPAPGGATDSESQEDDKDHSKESQNGIERFKFNYGFTGIPARIGHSKCGLSCDHSSVPQDKGWLWTAKNVPGLKFRPMWKPGAARKHVVRLLKIAKNPDIALSKKKKQKNGKPKKPLKRPLLTVEKKEGEYTVTMETMKTYSKQRALNQQPYEDKPLLTYTIGRTDEENHQRKMRKEREQRRLERDKRNFIQSAFGEMCKDVCLKTYQQALGILPGAEDPDCPCYPKNPGADEANLDISCSCSDDPDLSFGSDTDSDEWLVEFTPPNAFYDPKYKGKRKVTLDNSTQYTYLDYRVKLLDRHGKQVSRFFKGPDGKAQCSDLGGFWSPDHKWLKINTDGYIGPDNRWAPMTFIGPNKDQVNCKTGKFQVAEGKWLVVGVDGYVDATGRWKYYAKLKSEVIPLKKRHIQVSTAQKKGSGDKKDFKESSTKPSNVHWNCLGYADPKNVTKMGILGHGNDRKHVLKAVQEITARGENDKIPEPSVIPKSGNSKKRSTLTGSNPYDSHAYFSERERCKHAEPPSKGITAVDERGNKTYFRLMEHKDREPKVRLTKLAHQGICLSAFHVPCLNSFVNSEIMKKQLYERRMNMANANKPSSFGQDGSPGKYKIYKYRDTD